MNISNFMNITFKNFGHRSKNRYLFKSGPSLLDVLQEET
jgi:hypothetical protein